MSSSIQGTSFPQPPPYSLSPQEPSRKQENEDWEDWDDDDTIITPIDAGEQVLIETPPQSAAHKRLSKPLHHRSLRASIVSVKRLKSRKRQKAQNEQAGITVITDMATLQRQQQQQQQQQQRQQFSEQLRNPDGRPVKFVDAAALKALEGEQNSASVGNWNWLKWSKSPASTTTPKQPNQELSPEDRPIMIGIALPSDEASEREMSPQTAAIGMPMPIPNTSNGISNAVPSHNSINDKTTSPSPAIQHQNSIWSPDTPDTASSWSSIRVASSVYSQYTMAGVTRPAEDVPPVPALPANFKKTPQQKLISVETGNNGDDDDSGTPCTLFEEDGIPSPQKQVVAKGKLMAFTPTPDSAGSRAHGWWDHVVTPFMEKRLTFSTRKQKEKAESPSEKRTDDWWKSGDSKEPRTQYLVPSSLRVPTVAPIIVKTPTPRRTPSPQINSNTNTGSNMQAVSVSGPSSARASPRASPAPEKQQAVSEKSQAYFATQPTSSDIPPPYTDAEKAAPLATRYRAVFPPGHPLQAQYPPTPSPGPASPGLAATMTSQGATPLTDIPLTPAVARNGTPLAHMRLPDRPVGTFVPQEHSHDLAPGNDVERQRRRHEKEDVVARRVGGFWRGRGCIPSTGCFGRTGREGRRRRRIWMMVWGVIIAILILIIVLAVVLTRPKDSKEAPSIWLNLTDYPPMPTGVLTVVGPDNTVSKSGCTEPSTMWSCALPKEKHESVEPYKPDQPTIIMQIQYDNDTREMWNQANGAPPTLFPRRGLGAAAFVSNLLRKREEEFKPDPSPPNFKEMWFLGNITDDVKSENKGGESTPFYITLLDSVEDEIKPSEKSKREVQLPRNINLSDILPPPDLESDGTPKPATMLPRPVQQPVRLYDRDLPTEHYAFYTYFKRTIFLKSVTVLNKTEEENKGDVPLDEDGGSRKTEADFITTWAETRLLVRIWTKTLDGNSSSLLGQGPAIKSDKDLIRPGTMPYPVTVTLDTHGGDRSKKFVWAWPMDKRQQVDVKGAKLLANEMNVGGTWENPRTDGNKDRGGFDGGTSGCKCEWANWIATKNA